MIMTKIEVERICLKGKIVVENVVIIFNFCNDIIIHFNLFRYTLNLQCQTFQNSVQDLSCLNANECGQAI